jgi:arginine deiminase
MADEIRSYLDEEIDPTVLADHLIGGLTAREAAEILAGKGRPSAQARSRRARSSYRRWFPMTRPAPLPNSYFTRDPSAWIYGGVVVNPMYWPAPARGAQCRSRLPLPAVPRCRIRILVLREQGESFGRASSRAATPLPIATGRSRSA